MIHDVLLPYIHHPYFPHLLALVLVLLVLPFAFCYFSSKSKKARRIQKNQQRKDANDKKKVKSVAPSPHVTQGNTAPLTKPSGDPVRKVSSGVESQKMLKQSAKEPVAHTKPLEVHRNQHVDKGENQWITVDKSRKETRGSPGTSSRPSVEPKPSKQTGHLQASSGDTMINNGKWRLLESLVTEESIGDVPEENFDNARRSHKGTRYRRKD